MTTVVVTGPCVGFRLTIVPPEGQVKVLLTDQTGCRLEPQQMTLDGTALLASVMAVLIVNKQWRELK